MACLLSVGVARHSVASETSSDYALPPDDDDLPRRTDGSDTSEPEHKLLKCTNVSSLKRVSVGDFFGDQSSLLEKSFIRSNIHIDSEEILLTLDRF